MQNSRGGNGDHNHPAGLLISEHLWQRLYVEQGVSGHEGLFLVPGVKIHTSHNTVHRPGRAHRRLDSSIHATCMCIYD